MHNVKITVALMLGLAMILAGCSKQQSSEPQLSGTTKESTAPDSDQVAETATDSVEVRNPTVNIDMDNPEDIEKGINLYFEHEPVAMTDEARALHRQMSIVDWHTDTLLWKRDMLQRSAVGHADLPRLQDGNVAVQMFTTVTKSPEGQNYEQNSADAPDKITALAKAHDWPEETWDSLLARGIYQARKLDDAINRSAGAMVWVKTQGDLAALVEQRANAAGEKPVGALLGAEGAHLLEGNVDNLQALFDAGFRMVGLTHFFDNELGGSLHGASKAGLTDFGHEVVKRLDQMQMIIDLSHSSETLAEEVLGLTSRPVVVSHTGFKGACNTPRNFSDDLMKKIAAGGGLIALGFWDAAVCDPRPAGIAKALKYGVDLVGADHVALGSDWDGATKSITADELGEITQELLNLGVADDVIRKIMGENSIRFLEETLPQ